MFLAIALLLAAPLPTPFAPCAWVRAENDGAGAGFVVDAEKRLLVTCRHLVAGRKKVDVFFPWYREGELVTERADYLRHRGALRESKLLVNGTVLKLSDELDLALVQLDALPPGAQAVTFAARVPRPGEPLRAVGNRLDLDTLWNVSTGPLRTSGLLTEGYFWRGRKLAENAPVLIGQLPIEEGDSGGPVFDSRGELVGMACALRRRCPLAAVAISAGAIRRFAGASEVPAKEPELHATADALFRAAVWVRPTATDIHIAGALIENDLVLTCARGLGDGERVGVALPLRAGGKWVGDRAAYRDPLALSLRGAWRSGVVAARDPARDLALVRLDSPCDEMKPVPLAESIPKPGDALHAMGHPGGLEFAWVYGAGAVRQRGRVALEAGEKAPRVDVLVCQLPAQSGSPGGPVLNAKGELVGVLSAREGAQMVAYCATADEVRPFLDVSLRDRPAKTLAGLLARLESLPRLYAIGLAHGLAGRAESHRQAGRLAEAKRDCDAALSLDSACAAARLCRARTLPPEEAAAELDAANERAAFLRDALVLRAELAARAKDFGKARGDLQRVLDVFPADAEARQRLAGALLGLGEDAKAAAAVGDALRADPKRLPAIAADLLAQADTLEQKYPDAPSVAAEWLTKALAAAEKAGAKPAAEVLKAAAGAKSDADRLRVLRAGVMGLELGGTRLCAVPPQARMVGRRKASSHLTEPLNVPCPPHST
jgi:S1-C subfamily serine protease